MAQDIAAIVRFHRKRAGLTRMALSALAGVGKSTIYDIEHGKRAVQFDKLCAGLSLPASAAHFAPRYPHGSR